jgi:hypothetical protein
MSSCSSPTGIPEDNAPFSIPKGASSSPASVPQSDEKVAEKGGAGEAPAEPSPLDHLLILRSITINLTTKRPDGSGDSTRIDIDSAGNMLVKNSLPVQLNQDLPIRIDPTPAPTSYEVYVVTGKTFWPSELDATWMVTPVDDDYIAALSATLHGGEGIGLWLDLLPEGSLTEAGQETVGGFKADKFTVKGTVEGQEITGTLWYEPESGALIKADLVVPSELYDPMDKASKGPFKVNLDTEKAAIPLVKLPEAPAATLAPKTTPTSAAPDLKIPVIDASRQPVVKDIYPNGSYTGMGGKLETSPGRVWAASPALGLQEWDANAGKLLQTIPLPGITSLWDIKFDGQHIWVLASKENSSFADVLDVIDPANKKVLKEWTQFKQGDFDWDPKQMGFSPGKIWVANKIINTDSLAEEAMGKSFDLPADAHFAFDGKKWMWVTGTRCDGCGHDLWMFDVNDPTKVKDKGGTGESGVGTFGQPLTKGNGKMWLGGSRRKPGSTDIMEHNIFLDAYNPDKTDLPSPSVDVTTEFGDLTTMGLLAADNHYVWLRNGDLTSKTMYFHDQETGKLLGKLDLDTAGIEDIAFDGKDLWVLGMDKLVRISLPS